VLVPLISAFSSSDGNAILSIPNSSGVLQQAYSGALSLAANTTYTLKLETDGVYYRVYYKAAAIDSGSYTLLTTYADTALARGMLSEEFWGPLILTGIGATDNYVERVKITGVLPNEDTETVNGIKYQVGNGSIRHMALSASGGGTQNLYLSKGIQFAHRSRADGDFGVRKRQVVDGTHVKAWEQRVVNQFETGCTGVGRPFVTLLARGPWVMDNHTAEVIGADNFTADWDLDGAIFNSAYKYIVATGSATDGSNTSAHDWTSDGSDGVLPRGFQKVTSFGSGEDVRLSQIVRAANTAMETETFNLSSKWEQTGDPNSYAVNVAASDMTADDVISVARAFLVEQGSSISLDSSVLEDFRDDVNSPDTLTMTTGTAKTDAAGDYNTDGFNERHGWYEVTCDTGDIELTLNVPVSGTRFHPVFRLWSYTAGASPTVTIAGSGASAGTDYLIDDLGDGTAILQILSDRTADTDITLTGVDNTKPTVQSASINTAGSDYTIVYDEPVTGQTGHTLSASGGAVSLTPSSGDTTDTHVWSLDRTIGEDEVLTRSYSPGNAVDGAGNPLEAYSGQPVTNGVVEDSSSSSSSQSSSSSSSSSQSSDSSSWSSESSSSVSVSDSSSSGLGDIIITVNLSVGGVVAGSCSFTVDAHILPLSDM
jgi:hypothetical protein